MNKLLFQKQYAQELKILVESKFGQSLLAALGSLRPHYEFPPQEHLLSENRGAIRGYELCIRNILALSIYMPASDEVEANYGIPTQPKE